MTVFFVAVLEQNKEGRIFAYVPDLPGITAAGATRGEALSAVTDFANVQVRTLADAGEAVPVAREIDAIPVEADAPELGRALIPVEVPGKSVKISLSIDEALLKRVDRAAEADGTTRSGYFAAAAAAQLAAAVARYYSSPSSIAAPFTSVITPGALFIGGNDARNTGNTRMIVAQGLVLSDPDQDHVRAEQDIDFVPIVLTNDAKGHLVAGVQVTRDKKKEAGKS